MVMDRMKVKMIRNPIVHIVLFGILLAVVLFIAKGPPTSREETRRVVITDSDVEQLRSAWFRRWHREPTQRELRGQLEQFIREEILYREALARGFDRDDMIVRRAMQRKMEFLGEAQVSREPPTAEEIQAYFALRRERYRVPPKVSFVHVYFSRDKRGERVEEDAEETLTELRRHNPEFDELSKFGDRFMLHGHYVEQMERQLRTLFGENFASEVTSLEPGNWQGPVESGYGLHAVYVYDRQDSYVPEWTDIKDRIFNDMMFEAKKAAQEQFYQEILRQYQVAYEGQARRLLEVSNR